MSSRELELALKRGRLQERIAAQRATLAVQLRPIAGALATADQAIAVGRAGVGYVRQHPLQLGIAVAVAAVLRPHRIWRWGRRAVFAWGLWRKLRPRLEEAGLLARRSAA